MTRFDDIKELPVPEEWIAAYMDGNLDAVTTKRFHSGTAPFILAGKKR